MRAFWPRRNDENDERYRARTVGRLRGLASTEVVGRPSDSAGIRTRVERLKAESQPGPVQHRGTA